MGTLAGNNGNLSIKMIAPSHGPIWKSPSTIINAYKEWISEEVKNEVVIPYVSMHESTLIMVEYLVNELMKKSINVKPFNLPETDTGELAMSLVDAATVIVASPTVLAGAHPAAVYATFLMNALRPKTKFVGIIGSYGWGGKMVDQLSGLLGNLKVEIIDPVLVKGRPNEDDFDALDKLVEKIVENHKDLN
jgi:flavorubredoxin